MARFFIRAVSGQDTQSHNFRIGGENVWDCIGQSKTVLKNAFSGFWTGESRPNSLGRDPARRAGRSHAQLTRHVRSAA